MSYIKLPGEPNGDAGDQYTGLDRFGRVVDCRWLDSTDTDIDRHQYGFSQASNRLWRQFMLPDPEFDEQYLYDGLYQLSTRMQGILDPVTHEITGTPYQEEDFTYDPTGNWPEYKLKNYDGTTVLDQTRTSSLANEIASISNSGVSVGTGYDHVGNMTTMPKVGDWTTGQTVTWDAWNRLVTVSQSGTTLGTYRYDGLNRRVTKLVGSTTNDFYYSSQWQVLEEWSAGSLLSSFIWGVRYADDLAFREQGATRLYALADYFQTTSVASADGGTILERYVYTAFGDVSYYNSNYDQISSSYYQWTYLYGGYQLDLETNLYQVRRRYYHSALGRWINRDPLRNAENSQGANLYWYVSNNAVNGVDPSGLKTCPVHCMGEKIGELNASDLFYQNNRGAVLTSNAAANGIGVAIHFIANSNGKAISGKSKCCCDSYHVIQVTLSNSPPDPLYPFSIDNYLQSSPYYDTFGQHGDTVPAGYPGAGTTVPSAISIYDRPLRTDEDLKDIRGQDLGWLAYTFVICVRKNKLDRILLSGVTYGFKRLWDSSANTWGPPIGYGPKCTGLKSFPKGDVQDAIENDPSSSYRYRDNWIWDR